ncbi:MAG: DUF3301 domain-containing protein [Gammaproteobacteria bacterium]|nr:DUF3301 domain-containing protein [Rhodocyclaceae bacterium]MBU3910039.1 DUF3301 domain-containing protein [Gammaproteobacteria bacterium]MBU3990524.1 DUF3301 domain-containing protein [Gammaproteobacteria bacterium]MBU4004012.1 DUF3301 domain-containing protein [Gammaproteobacteria bacterium]MBU4020259.1 DUF3301 domain-containing protein [Gammaproteobacteria bacterium]
MPIFEIISLLILFALAWLWFDSVKVRDIAVKAAQAACLAEDLQLLDATVSITSLKPARDENGQMVLRRVYAFEYSDTGNNRRPGSIGLLGQEVLFVNVGLRPPSEVPTLH